MELVLGRLPATIELCLVAMLLATGLGGAMALAGAYWRGRLRIDAFGSVPRHMALPLAAIIARVLEASINEAMTQDYILMARVKGFSRARIVGREALRNALLPTLTLAGVRSRGMLVPVARRSRSNASNMGMHDDRHAD